MKKFVRENNSAKWQNHSNDEFVMTIAELDLPISTTLKKSIVSRLEMMNNFTYKNRSEQYFQSIIRWYQSRHIKETNIKLKRQQIVQSPSLLNLIYIVIQNWSEKKEGVLLLTPIFYQYTKMINYLGRTPIECKLYNEKYKNTTRYDINFTDLEKKAKQCKIMIFCNPHNPTGRLWNKAEVQKIVNICKENNIILISDQILSDLVPQKFQKGFYSLVNSNYENLIVCNSISKAFNALSLKGGYGIIKSEALRNKYNDIIEYLALHTNQFALNCTEIFYTNEGIQWLNSISLIIQNNYNYLREKIKNTMLYVSQFEGLFVIVISFEGYVKFIERWFHSQKNKAISSQNMVSFFLRENKIQGALMPYPGLYPNIYTQVRFSIGVEEDYFKRFADKLTSVLLEVQYVFRQINSKL